MRVWRSTGGIRRQASRVAQVSYRPAVRFLRFSCICDARTMRFLRDYVLTFPLGGGESWSQEKCLDRTLRQTPAASALRCVTVLTAAVFFLGTVALRADEIDLKGTLATQETVHDKRWEVSLETGCIFGLKNPNNYVIAPQFFSLGWQPFPQWKIGPVRLRAQILATFTGEAILQGPESYFLGGALQMRLIFPIGDSRWALYADGGGRMGAVDSDDTPLGQGEDFAFCLLASGGVRFAVSQSWSV